ncbi:AMP-binding protein, partial [Singulisphaera rosea]
MNVADLLKEAAGDRASHTAFLFEGRAWSYTELDRVTDRCANAFVGLGVREGEVVAIFLESGPELLTAYLGALKCGAVPNVVN